MIISVSSLKNWFLNDKICDVLNTNFNNFGFEKDKNINNHFCELGNEYEKEIVNEIILFCDSNNYTYKQANRWNPVDETETSILNNVNVIFQAHFYEDITKDIGLNGYADILIHKELLIKLVENKIFKIDYEKIVNLLHSYKSNEYIIIDVKYSHIKFDIDYNIIIESKYNEYIYAQVMLYIQLYNQVYKKHTKNGFLLNKNKELINITTENDIMKNKIRMAIRWLKNCFDIFKNITNKTELYESISIYDLYPNVCNIYDSPWSTAKREIAIKLKDIGLIFGVGLKIREYLHSKKIFSYSDIRFLEECKNIILTDFAITEKITQNLLKDINNDRFYKEIERVEDPEVLNIYLDIESVNIKNKSYISLVGFAFINEDLVWQYVKFINKDLEDDTNLNTFKNTLTNFSRFYKLRIIYYAGDESKLLEGINVYQQVDLYKTVKSTYITSNKMDHLKIYNLKLKSIITELQRLGYIREKLYENTNCKNGLDALSSLYKYYTINDKTKKEEIMNDVVKYNEADCKSTYYLYHFLQSQ